ncbi:hypothetical protein ASG89_04365 [Paenibacillus sp. Soil766]|uniref:hypothetical protein n=1 Tax=Paenibacillus sp. Soil766 TaxID=1736404 RepID=UPI000710A1BA|nr:hypothetical protein [Paenibacillus sp. Soil766]KRE98255.1 hypothetical protein ASG89_04365 [Paenibacillus sp. Soil766]
MEKNCLKYVGAGIGIIILCLLPLTGRERPTLTAQSQQHVSVISEVDKPNQSSEMVRKPLIEQLRFELSQVNKPDLDMTEWLQTRVTPYDSQKELINVIRTDLDQDGVSNEWVSVLFEDILDKQTGLVQARQSYGVIIDYRDSQFSLQSLSFPSENYGRSKVMTIDDLTGDSKSEVVWVSMNNGAHTTFSEYIVSSWVDRKLETYEGTAVIASVSKAEIQDRKLQLSGGLIGSVGAGPWQQEFTESYAIFENKLKRTGRVYVQSPTPYHRLISGMWAESHGYREQAMRDYTEAVEMQTPSYQDYAFIFEGEWVQGGLNPDQEAMFDRTIKRFSQLRKELLTEVSSGVDPRNACLMAKKKTGFDMTWLTYLNAPAGYANPHWEEGTICVDIALLEQ